MPRDWMRFLGGGRGGNCVFFAIKLLVHRMMLKDTYEQFMKVRNLSVKNVAKVSKILKNLSSILNINTRVDRFNAIYAIKF